MFCISCTVGVKPQPTDGILPTKLYCTNKDVDSENKNKLAELPGTPVAMTAADSWRVLACRVSDGLWGSNSLPILRFQHPMLL